MQKHPIRALLLDIDGTLLPEGKLGVSAPIVDRVRRMRRSGVTVVIATGRSGFVVDVYKRQGSHNEPVRPLQSRSRA